MPKLLIALTLLVFGFLFIFDTEDRIDIILNAVALVFVLEIDEMLFKFAVPSDMQQTLNTVKEYKILYGGRTFFKFFLLFSIAGSMVVFSFCEKFSAFVFLLLVPLVLHVAHRMYHGK